MGDFFDLSTVAKRLRFFGVVEAVTWVFLLIGSVLKRLPDPITWPVTVFGLAHGIVFILFVITALLAWRELEWKPKTIGLGLLSSVVPFCTLWFEYWVQRTGQLGELSAPAESATASSARS